MALISASSELSISIPFSKSRLGRAEIRARSPTAQSSALSYPPQHKFEAANCAATQLGGRISDDGGEGHFSRSSSSSLFGGARCEKEGAFRNRRNRLRGCVCQASGGSAVGSSEWMSKTTPYEVLGVSMDSTEDEIKTAFRNLVRYESILSLSIPLHLASGRQIPLHLICRGL